MILPVGSTTKENNCNNGGGNDGGGNNGIDGCNDGSGNDGGGNDRGGEQHNGVANKRMTNLDSKARKSFGMMDRNIQNRLFSVDILLEISILVLQSGQKKSVKI